MIDDVMIKSNKFGIEVQLNPEIHFDKLLEEVALKFHKASKFFGKSEVAISFNNRYLTNDQERQLINIITDMTSLKIICVIDNSEKTERLYKTIIEQNKEHLEKVDGQFYRGTLKKRQLLESETSVIVLGNVEKGAKIIAKGNVIIMGCLQGSVHAGAPHNKDAFITAYDMQPKVLKIGDVVAKRHILRTKDDIIIEPKIAIVDGEHIYIDPLI